MTSPRRVGAQGLLCGGMWSCRPTEFYPIFRRGRRPRRPAVSPFYPVKPIRRGDPCGRPMRHYTPFFYGRPRGSPLQAVDKSSPAPGREIPLSVFYTETPKTTVLSRTMASVRQITSAAPAAFSTRTHSPSVAPVVRCRRRAADAFRRTASGDHRLVSAQHVGPALRPVIDTGLGRIVQHLTQCLHAGSVCQSTHMLAESIPRLVEATLFQALFAHRHPCDGIEARRCTAPPPFRPSCTRSSPVR